MNYPSTRSTVFTVTAIITLLLIPLGAYAQTWVPVSLQGDSSVILTRTMPSNHQSDWYVYPQSGQHQYSYDAVMGSEEEQPKHLPSNNNIRKEQPTGASTTLQDIRDQHRVGPPSVFGSGGMNHRAFMHAGFPDDLPDHLGIIPAGVLFQMPSGTCSPAVADAVRIDFVVGCEYEVEVKHALNGEVEHTYENLEDENYVVTAKNVGFPADGTTVWIRARVRVKLMITDYSHTLADSIDDKHYYAAWSGWTPTYRVDYDAENSFVVVSGGTTTPDIAALYAQYQEEEEAKQKERLPLEGNITLRVTAITYNSVTLSWDLPAGVSATRYVVRKQDRAVDGEFIFAPIRTGSTDTTYTVTDLDPTTLYSFSVKAYGTTRGTEAVRGFDTFSPWVNVRTKHAPEEEPGDL